MVKHARLKRLSFAASLAAAVAVFPIALGAVLLPLLVAADRLSGEDGYVSRVTAVAICAGVALALAYLPSRWVFLTMRWRTLHEDDHCCKSCGYDLTGNVSGACPECGEAIGNSKTALRWRCFAMRRRLAWILIVFAILVSGYSGYRVYVAWQEEEVAKARMIWVGRQERKARSDVSHLRELVRITQGEADGSFENWQVLEAMRIVSVLVSLPGEAGKRAPGFSWERWWNVVAAIEAADEGGNIRLVYERREWRVIVDEE